MYTAPRLKLLAAALLFSTGGAAIKACSLSSWGVASLRSGIAAVTLLAVLPETRRRWSAAPFLVGVAYAATLTFFVLANKLTTSANAIYLQSTAPLYLLLLGPWLLREPVRRRDVGFLAALAAGLALFFVGEEPGTRTAPAPLAGNLLALGSGVSWAFTLAGLRRLGGSPEASAQALVAGNAIAFLVALPPALPIGITPADAALLLWLGPFQIALAYVLLRGGLREVPALEASLLLLVEPVFNPLWAFLFHGERPGPWAAAGAVVILAATVAQSVERNRATRLAATARR